MRPSQAEKRVGDTVGGGGRGAAGEQTSDATMAAGARYPGVSTVIHGNGAVAHVMGHVCGGVIGYPITPSTEISELFEAYRAKGGCNVWGKHPFFFEPEGEHSAQSGAMGATLTGGKYVSNASSSQGVLYGIESHYVTVGKKIGGFVLQVAARSVSRHSLNVMAGHDDVYALLPAGYTILFGSNQQEAADLAAIAYKVSAESLVPVANCQDGFATSHMLSEAYMPEPELLKEFLGDPAGRIKCPTLAQEMLYGAKGRVFQLREYLRRHEGDFPASALEALVAFLDSRSDDIEADNDGALVGESLQWVPTELHGQWRRQWRNAFEKGTRQRVPAMMDVNNPGLSGGVQNQPDFQAGIVDHRTHFANEVHTFVREAMDEYSVLTGRRYLPVRTFMTEDADYVIVGLGSVTDDAEAVAAHLRREGMKVGVVSIKMLQPFPEGDVVAALDGKKAVTILERSETTALTTLVTQAMFKALENGDLIRHEWIPPIRSIPKISTGIFGLGAHDLQPRHLVAAFRNMENVLNVPFFYLGSQFFEPNPSGATAALQQRLRDAYPETEFMALDLEPNPSLLPPGALRIRFHSVGGYGTIATGKLLTDILAGVTGMHSKSSPKYGSEKSGAPTNYYITLSPEPIKITNAELEDVEVVVSPDHKAFSHTDPLKGLAEGGTLIIQSGSSPLDAWKELPAHVRRAIRERRIRLFVVDAFGVAKKHAPSPDLEIRMMGIAFIGAVCGKVERVASGAPVDVILEKVQGQVSKKFGAKGDAVVNSNMAVVQEGLEATHAVDYEAAEFVKADALAAVPAGPGVEVSVSMLKSRGSASASGMFDAEYYARTVTDRFKDGSIVEAPVIPGVGMFMPSGSAAYRDKGLFRLTVPRYTAHLCTGCMECALTCPDGAIPNTVHEIHDLLLTAIKQMDVTEQQKQLLTAEVFPLTKGIRDAYRKLPAKDETSFKDITAEEVARMGIDNPTLRRSFEKLVEALAVYPVVKTRPFFDAMEKEKPGSGGLYSVNVDPWKCSGCGECVDVCGPGALTVQQQNRGVQVSLQNSFQFLSRMPNTAPRFTENALLPGGDAKRVILDHDNYYAMTGGHGACRGCGEVTSLRLLNATNRALHEQKRRRHIVELEELLDSLKAKTESFEPDELDPNRRQRMQRTAEILEKRLYRYESGPTGMGPAGAAIANATGCSSVYASTFPFNPYNVPWVNSLFQDSVPVAKGIFEGLCASEADDFAALRTARLDLEDQYNPEVHDGLFRTFYWQQFSREELDLMPAVIAIGGDGATYDIGFGALSRLLVTATPLKIVVLDTGAYSNTGGQASTASFTAQDSDLTRFGVAHRGKHEDRKELGLIAAFHPKVLVVQTNSAFQGHFMKNLMEFLNYNESPAIFNTYTACMPEHGIGDDAGNRHARLAVESRMSPMYVHDPRKGDTLAERFSLEGNPDIGQDWTTGTLEYLDDDGNIQLKEIPLTPADFGVKEGRFKKHFNKIGGDADRVPLHEYIDLDVEDRHGKTPFIWSTDAGRRLVQLEVSSAMVALTQERRRNWRMLEYLSGLHINRMEESHSHEVAEWRARYEQADAEREASIDSIARGMAELAAASGAPSAGASATAGFSVAIAPPVPKSAATGGVASGGDLPLVEITEEDMAACTNCKTCYQDLGELFELTRIMVDGAPKEVSRVKPGILASIELTPDLIQRARKVADNCDAEIIRFHNQG